MTFTSVDEFKKRLLKSPLIGLEQNIIDTADNEWRKRLRACVRAMGRHFEHFHCRQLKNGQFDELSASDTNVDQMLLCVILIQ